jgi:hypothetical protein
MDNNDEVTTGSISKATWPPRLLADGFLGRIYENVFNVFNSEAMLGNVLDIPVQGVVIVPNDLQEAYFLSASSHFLDYNILLR